MTILMIRPKQFGYNPQTAVNNAFQRSGNEPDADVQRKAVQEFGAFVEKLRANDIDVMVVPDTREPHTPDSIFPNNWVSFHEDGTLVLYPMFAENRRLERKQTVFEAIKQRFAIHRAVDYTQNEDQGKFLEGTGSFVLDRIHKIAYACRSPRMDESLFSAFCEEMGYKPVVFDALDSHGNAIYHTNVLMCVADRYAVICLDSIVSADRDRLVSTLESSGKTVIPITYVQMAAFAGNMLQVENKRGERFLVMSSQAFHSLPAAQLQQLQAFNPIIHSPLYTIEQNGGGSARCMMAEIFLPILDK